MDENSPHSRFAGRRKNGQFQKGVSGNPNGAPRKKKSTRAIFQEMLASKVQMVVDGRAKRLSVTEAMAARVKKEALTGPLRGLERGVAFAERYSFEDPPPKDDPEMDFSLLDDEEFTLLNKLICKASGKEYVPPEPMTFDRYLEEKADAQRRRDAGEDLGDDAWLLDVKL